MAKKKPSVSYEDRLHRDLLDPAYAAAYLTECLSQDIDDGGSTFLVALGEVARARGMSQLADATALGRESLYKTLSDSGNPTFQTLLKILRELDLQISLVPQAKVG